MRLKSGNPNPRRKEAKTLFWRYVFMSSQRKRWISLLLVLVLMLSIVPMTALAQNADPVEATDTTTQESAGIVIPVVDDVRARSGGAAGAPPPHPPAPPAGGAGGMPPAGGGGFFVWIPPAISPAMRSGPHTWLLAGL